jgi:hypothetical protein
MFSVALGHDVESGQEVRLGDIERRSGLYLLGKMGMGKSALCVNIARQDIENGHGIFFLDPHGEAINELLRTGDYFSLQLLGALFDVEDEEYSFGINLLHCGNVASIRQRNDTYTRAYNVFYKIWEDQWGPWLQLFLQNILRAFIENQDYTLADVPMFLNPQNVDFRNHIISNIKYNPAVADFWRHEFFQRRESAQQERVDAALTRINTLLTDDYVRHIVGQKQTTLDFEMLLTLPNILLFKLSANLAEDAKKFIGSILVSELLHAVRNRPEGEREQFCLFIDEFQNFSGHDDMSLMITEGRKFKLASTFLHVERFGQLANQQKLMGATLATANKVFLQLIVPDAQESAPEFAKRVEATEERREAELILSPHPVEDIWDRGHPHKAIMGLREKCFWIVDLLRSNPSAKYFVFDSSRLSPEFLRYNPIDFAVEDFDDWQYYRVSADMLKQGIAVLNQFFYNWMSGKYDPNVVATSEQIELITQIIENIGPLFGFLPMLRPYIPTENRERLLYLINETIRKHHAEDRRDKVAAKRAEIQYLKDHGIRLVET